MKKDQYALRVAGVRDQDQHGTKAQTLIDLLGVCGATHSTTYPWSPARMTWSVQRPLAFLLHLALQESKAGFGPKDRAFTAA